MNKLIINTPTQLDLRELFTLGLGSKRGQDKIGHKGSGMKFCVALLHRLGSNLHVKVGPHDLTSISAQETIRGQEHRLIRLVGTSGGQASIIETHIAETAGADTWNEAWFALRELIQNALDENGQYFALPEGGEVPANQDGTTMIVQLTEPLQAAWDNRQTWLHPRHPEVIYDAPGATGLYYHGFRVYSGRNWRWAYDVTELLDRDKLSEDRQLRNVNFNDLCPKIIQVCPELPDDFYTIIRHHHNNSNPIPEDVDLLRHSVYILTDSHRPNVGGFKMPKLEESVLDWSCGKKVAFTTETDPDSPTHYHATAHGYTVLPVDHYTAEILRYSENSLLADADKILPSAAARMQPVKDLHIDVFERLKTAKRLTKKLQPPGCRIRVTKMKHQRDSIGAVAWADVQNCEVLLMEDFVNQASTEQMVEALIEEYVHISSHASDGSISFEKALIKAIARLLLPRRALVEAL